MQGTTYLIFSCCWNIEYLQNCEAGKSSAAGSFACTNCEQGYYQDQSSQGTCKVRCLWCTCVTGQMMCIISNALLASFRAQGEDRPVAVVKMNIIKMQPDRQVARSSSSSSRIHCRSPCRRNVLQAQYLQVVVTGMHNVHSVCLVNIKMSCERAPANLVRL